MHNLLSIIFLFGTLLSNFTASSKADRVATNNEITSYQIGDKVEDFSLLNTDGESISLSQYEDAKGYIIAFTSNVCPFAIANEDRLIQIHNAMAPQGYPVIAINSNGGDEESLDAMKKKVNDKNIPFAYLKDNASVYEKFGATKTPHIFLLDGDMTLQYTGSVDDSPRSVENVEEEFLVNAIDALKNNRTPNPAITKSIGCPIKRGGDTAGRERKGPPNQQALMERMDENKDGKISTAEAKGPLAADFDKLDTDNDGLLTLTELSNAKPKRRKSR